MTAWLGVGVMTSVSTAAVVDPGACRALCLPPLRAGDTALLLGRDREGGRRGLLADLLVDALHLDPSLAVVVVDASGAFSSRFAKLNSGFRFVDYSYRYGVNVLDPVLFPSRDVVVAAVARTLEASWGVWGPRLADCVMHGCQALYAGNMAAGVARYGLADLGRLWHPDTGGHELRAELSGYAGEPFRCFVAFYDRWSSEVGQEVATIFDARMGSFARQDPAASISVVDDFPILLECGGGLCLNLGADVAGCMAASLAGTAILAELDLALGQVSPERRCLLAVDDVALLAGVDWQPWFSERTSGPAAALLLSGVAEREWVVNSVHAVAEGLAWALALAGTPADAEVNGEALCLDAARPGALSALPLGQGFLWECGVTGWSAWSALRPSSVAVC